MLRLKVLSALSVAALMVALMAGAALAAISGTTGGITEISAPAAVQQGDMESNSQISAFAEKQGFALTHDIIAGITEPGEYTKLWELSAGRISEGTMVDSYMLHSDPVNRPWSPVDFSGSITFDEDVIGVIVTSVMLGLTDNMLGSDTTDYPTYTLGRGVEMFGRQDKIALSSDMRTVTVDFETSRAVDQIRILTKAGMGGNPQMVEIDTHVMNSDDDAYDNTDGAFPGYSHTDFRIYAGNVNGRPMTGGFRWTGLNIPANATIVEAYVELNQRDFGFVIETTLTLENSPAPAAFTSSSSPTDRMANPTAFSQAWTWPQETPGSWIQTPSLTAGIQELVDTHGAIDSIVLLEDGTGVPQNQSHQWQSSENGEELAPRLHIVYQTP